MDSAEIEQCFEVALGLVKEAGQVVREAIKKQKTIETKSCNVDLVTESDKAVEKLLIEGLASMPLSQIHRRGKHSSRSQMCLDP
ncbi:hypothetical protein O3P69_020943 [Scylla paramamosain]|uniref:Uncharacterized protein n=1 Tax=Scylla paramamosain TaxID=85552 RepID=A0AAW0SFW4_SCYPA